MKTIIKKILSLFKNSKDSKKNNEKQDYDRWWHAMNIPLMDIPQEDLEWAVNAPFNSYCSRNGFLAEIERRKTL